MLRVLDRGAYGLSEAAELLCFAINAPRNAPKFTKHMPVYVHDTFGVVTLDVEKPQELCVPVVGTN